MNMAKTMTIAAPAPKRSAYETHRERPEGHLHRHGQCPAALHVAEAGRAECAAHGADPERREERAVALRILPEDVLREHRQERDERERAEAPHEREADEPTEPARVAHGDEARLEVLKDASARGAGRRPAFQEEEGDDDREERETVQAEARRRAQLVERDARENGADDAREIELDRVQGDGVRKVLPVDERRHERLVRGAAERLREAHDDRQHENHPDLDVIREDEAGEQERRRQLNDLREEEDSPAVPPVGEDASEEREEEERRLLEEGREAQPRR